MAIGLASNMKVFPDQFLAGYVEVLSQNSNAFNALSAGAMLLFPAMSRGHGRVKDACVGEKRSSIGPLGGL